MKVYSSDWRALILDRLRSIRCPDISCRDPQPMSKASCLELFILKLLLEVEKLSTMGLSMTDPLGALTLNSPVIPLIG